MRKGATWNSSVHSSRKLETACSIAGDSCWKFLYEDFVMFRCRSDDRLIDQNGDSTSDNKTLLHDTYAKEPSLGSQKISATTLPLTSAFSTPPVSNTFDYYVVYSWARNLQNTEQHQRWTEGKDNDSIYLFKQGEHQKDFEEIPKLSGCYGWGQRRFLWINSVYSISRYFNVIFGKYIWFSGCQCYFHFCVI